jgi:hypothetical protein
MTSNISPGDWESLSAYVDYQLSEQERILLDGRLQVEPELQRALEEARLIKASAWYAPRRRAPRNYTLSPGKAGVRLSSPLYPAFRLASVLASLMFAMVLVGDFMAGVTTGVPILARMAPPETAQVQVMEMALEAAAPMEAAALPTELPTELPAEALSMAAEPPANQPPEPNADLAAKQAPQATQTPMPAQEVAQEAVPAQATLEEFGIGGGPVAKSAVTETPTPIPTVTLILPPPSPLEPAAAAQIAPEQLAEDQASAGVAEEAQAAIVAETTVKSPDGTLFTIPYINRWWVWGVEGLLLALAGLALVAALLTRRLR